MKTEELATDAFNLIPHCVHFLRSRLNLMADGHMSIPQFRILMHLESLPAGQSELCAHLGVRAPTLSRMLRCLLKRGFVTRETSKTDGRLKLLKITRDGKKYLRAYRAEILKELNLRVRDLPAKKTKELVSGITALRELFATAENGERQ